MYGACRGWARQFSVLSLHPRPFSLRAHVCRDPCRADAESRSEAEWRARNRGYELVVSVPYTSACQPAFSLVASRENRMAILSIRGSNSLDDLFTDGKATTVPLLNGTCHEGIHTAAEWILGAAGMVAIIGRYCHEGYRVVLTGHSLGGGVALICGLMLSRSIANLSVYAYGAPACIDKELADTAWVKQNVLNIVHRDDFVPRASVVNVAHLAREIQGREHMIASSYKEDVQAMLNRMKTLWAPPSRVTKLWDKKRFVRLPDPAPLPPAVTTAGAAEATYASDCGSIHVAATADAVQIPIPSPDGARATPSSGAASLRDVETLPVPAAAAAAPPSSPDEAVGPSWQSRLGSLELPRWAQWRMRQPTSQTSGTEKEPESFHVRCSTWSPQESHAVDEFAMRVVKSLVRSAVAEVVLEADNGVHEDDYVEVCREDVLTKPMVLGGRVLHLYQYRGQCRASVVDHSFKPFHRIELHGNTISDHTLESVADALRSVKASRRADREPPQWMSMADERARHCMVCFCEVTWATTSSSDAEHARTMRHCRACGVVVCPECSTRKMTLPQIGIIVSSRVCDRCFWTP